MKIKNGSIIWTIVAAVLFLFSGDLISFFSVEPLFGSGTITLGYRLPLIGGALVCIIFALGDVMRVHLQVVLWTCIVTAAGVIVMILGGYYPIGNNLNVFQFLWFMISSLILGIIFIVLLFFALASQFESGRALIERVLEDDKK